MFQFQKGAIKRNLNYHIDTLVGWFQFQKGAIKSALNQKLKMSMILFQFQKGAIKSFIISGFLFFSHKRFQFQKGAIKSSIGASRRAKQEGFNSKKVQLRDWMEVSRI